MNTSTPSGEQTVQQTPDVVIQADANTPSLESLQASIKALETNNSSLLGELKNSREHNKNVMSTLGLEGENISDQVKKVASVLEAEKLATKESRSESEKLRDDMTLLQDAYKSMTDNAERSKSEATRLTMESQLKDVLNETGVTPNGVPLIMNFVKSGLQKDENGYFAENNGQRISIQDFAKQTIQQFPELIQREIKGGSGSKAPAAQPEKTYESLIAAGKFSEARAFKQ